MGATQLGKVLVVDDEVELKNILVETLTAQGYEVTGYTSAEQALAELQSYDFDLLLTDLMMPEMDGISLVKASLAVDPHLVAIVMTGQGTIQTAVDAMKVGAFDYVLKPFRLQSFLPVLTRAMNSRRLRQENLQLRETVAIYGLSQTIAFTLDRQTILSKLADAALQQTDADEVSVLLPTGDGEQLYVAAVRGENRARLLGERVPLDSSISGWVARERVPLMLEGEVNDERFHSCWPHPEIRSSLSVPMQVANKLVGTININAKKRPRPFTLGQMKALTILASTAAGALESASLYEQVRKAEENYRSIFENAIEGVFRATPDGVSFISVNPAMAQMFGYDTPKEMVDSVNGAMQQLGVGSEYCVETVRSLVQNGVLENFEVEAHRKNGSVIWISANLHCIYTAEGEPSCLDGTVENIAERKRMEEALRISEEQLRQSQKLEAIGQLAGGIAHDFNNLLTVIGGYAELLLRRLPEDSPFRTSAEEIKKAGDRAGGLTRQLLAFSRKQILQPKVIDLNGVVSDLDRMLRRLIGEDIDLVSITEPGLGQVKVDPGQVEQVIMNLAVNARDAMPNGGQLTVRTSNVQLSEDYVTQTLTAVAGKYVMLAISDNGCGMDLETRERIFEPFFTTKGAGKGTGLGLSTVYGIVKQSGGHLWVYSEIGKGTTFKIYFPRLDEPCNGDMVADDSTPVPRGNETILMVEDEEQVREIANEILTTLGYRVLVATDGEVALTLAKEHEGEIQLMITDVVMPSMGGRECVERLTPSRPEMKVLFMSGYTDDAIVRHGLLDQRLEFIEKPFTSDALARKVRKVLDSVRTAEHG